MATVLRMVILFISLLISRISSICETQVPCLQISITYNNCTAAADTECSQISVVAKYDDDNDECAKDSAPISHVCFGTDEIYPYTSEFPDDVGKIEDFPVVRTVTLTGECDYMNNYVEIGFKDAQACDTASDKDALGALLISFHGDDTIDCEWDHSADICDAGSDDQCVYKIYYDRDRCVHYGDESVNIFGMRNASKTTTVSIWGLIFIVGAAIILGIVGFVYVYYSKRYTSQEIEKEMVIITNIDTPKSVGSSHAVQSPQSAQSTEIK